MNALFCALTNITMVVIVVVALIVALGFVAIVAVTVKNLAAVVIQKIEDKFREADDRWFLR